MRIPLLEGRDFTAAGRAEYPAGDDRQPGVRRRDSSAARARWAARCAPSERTVPSWGWPGTASTSVPAEPPSPYFYLPFQQFYNSSPELYFLVRTAGQPVQSIPLLRRAVAETDPNAGAFHAVSLAEYTEVATFGQKGGGQPDGRARPDVPAAGGLGLYSVMSYTVSQRIPEIGIRMAMGARPAQRDRDGGAAGHVAGPWRHGRGHRRSLCRQLAWWRACCSAWTRRNPVAFLLAALFLGAVALLATWIPAFRATRTDPMQALRR